MGSFGATEILLVILAALLLFGAGRIADIGRGLGEGIRNFKKGIRDDSGPADDALAATEGAEPVATLSASNASEPSGPVESTPASNPAPAPETSAEEPKGSG